MAYNVLVADDSENVLEAWKAYLAELRYEGYEFKTRDARDGGEALRILSEQPKLETSKPGEGIDLVVTDGDMPVKTGIEVIAEGIKISPKTKFILTSARSDDYSGQALALGATVLGKPMSIDAFFCAVKAYLPPQNQ